MMNQADYMNLESNINPTFEVDGGKATQQLPDWWSPT